MTYDYVRMPRGEHWLEQLPARYRDGHNGFDIRIARELAAVGVRCYTVDDLANGLRTIPPAIPIFVDWLERLDERIPGPETHHRWAIRTGLIRNLIDPAAKRNRRAIEVLFAQLNRADPALEPHVEFWAVLALDTIAERRDYDQMAGLLETLPHVASKDPVLHYLGQFRTEKARQLILPYVTDLETRSTAIKALARFKNAVLAENLVHAGHAAIEVALASASPR
jgi:hypothetical protein